MNKRVTKNDVIVLSLYIVMVIIIFAMFILGFYHLKNVYYLENRKTVKNASTMSSIKDFDNNALLIVYANISLMTSDNIKQFKDYVKKNNIQSAHGMPVNFTVEDFNIDKTFLLNLGDKVVVADTTYIKVDIIKNEEGY